MRVRLQMLLWPHIPAGISTQFLFDRPVDATTCSKSLHLELTHGMCVGCFCACLLLEHHHLLIMLVAV